MEKTNEINNDSQSKTKSIENKLIYRIQIGAFEEVLPKEIFKGVNDVVFFKGDDNIFRYNSEHLIAISKQYPI